MHNCNFGRELGFDSFFAFKRGVSSSWNSEDLSVLAIAEGAGFEVSRISTCRSSGCVVRLRDCA